MKYKQFDCVKHDLFKLKNIKTIKSCKMMDIFEYQDEISFHFPVLFMTYLGLIGYTVFDDITLFSLCMANKEDNIDYNTTLFWEREDEDHSYIVIGKINDDKKDSFILMDSDGKIYFYIDGDILSTGETYEAFLTSEIEFAHKREQDKGGKSK